MKSNDIFDSFLVDFVNRPKFSGLTPSEKDDFKQNLYRNYLDRVNSVIILNTPSDRKEEFISLLERDNQDELNKFLNSVIPNFDILIQNETSVFIADLMETLNK